MSPIEDQLAAIFNNNPQVPRQRPIRDVVQDHRKKQAHDAFMQAYADNKAQHFQIPCIFGMGLTSGLMGYLCDLVPEAMHELTGKEVTGESAKWVFGTDSMSEEFIHGLEGYASRYGMKHTDTILENPKAVSSAITKAYGSMEEYRNDIYANVMELNNGLMTIDRMSIDSITDAVSGLIGGKDSLNPMSVILEGYAQKLKRNEEIKRWSQKGNSIRTQAVEFGQDFLKAYAQIRVDETNLYG